MDSLGINSFILDENHIWWATAGNDPVLYITTDGGQTWEANTALSRPKKMAFFDQNIGIASDLPYFYYTEDGGRTWTEKGRLSRAFGKIIFGSTPAEAYITSASNFYITQDTFTSFEEMKSLFGASDLNGFYFNPSDSSYLIGASYSTIASSLDEGETWTDISGKLKPHITAMYSQNGQNVYAAGSKMILYTEDGGIDWKFLDTTAIPVRSMEISSEGNLILSGTQRINQKDLSTLEESTLYGPVPGIFQDFHITPSGRWIAYNTTDYYLISEDNGISWDSFYIDEFSNGIDKAYNDDLFIRIRGKLLQSNDEGTSWNEIYNASVARDIRALSVVDSTIYIMESTRNLRKSVDYGASWDSLAMPTSDPMIVTELHFINQDTGYLYDQTGGRLWYTFDGGETWPFAYFPKSRLNGMYEFRNNDLQSTWLFGFGGFIEKQSDCKNPPLLSDIEGTVFPCILDTVTFLVNGSNIDKYFWSVPDEWEIVNDDNGSEITIYAIDPGVGYLTVYGENACGQTDALELQIAGTSIPDVELLDLGDLLRTEADGEFFQWFKDGILIPDATESFYVPTESGDYSILVTFSTGCSRLSNVINVFISSVNDQNLNQIHIYPNPANQVLFIHSENQSEFKVTVTNMQGQVVFSGENQKTIDAQHFLSGLHIVELKDRHSQEIKREIIAIYH